MEWVIWGIWAVIGFIAVMKFREYLEGRRKERIRLEMERLVMLAKIQIYKEKYGKHPTGRDMLRWHDELRGL